MNDPQSLWLRYQKHFAVCPSIALTLDISRMRFDDGYFDRMKGPIDAAFAEMAELEKGAIVNRDEKRMVGHYWLRNPALAPNEEIRGAIATTRERILAFAKSVHDRPIRPPRAE